MTEISGKKGKMVIGASDMPGVRNIRFAMNGNNQQHSSSSSPGHKRSVDGVKSGTVSGELIYDMDDPIEDRLKVGDLVTVEIYQDRDETGRKWIVPARIDSLEVNIDIENGAVQSAPFEASTHGAWTYPDGTVSV